jgi:hypothetical protein
MTDAGFVSYKGNDVQGHQTSEDVLELMNYAESLPNSKEKE